MEPTSNEIKELRSMFLQKVQEENRDFHPKDISKAENDDNWIRRFLIHHDLNMNDALAMMLDTCEWRMLNKVNELNEQTVNMDYLSEGSLFVHSRDKDGKSLFIFKCKKHVKGQKNFEELKKCVIYWFERVERQDKGDQITIVFDMAETGLANMDMEYTKYLINLCKQYYPHFLNYILIFEMPWVLNAAFKVIKSWLPTKAVQKIKFVTKSTMRDYVNPEQALKCWGGLDGYEFTFVPEDLGKSEECKKKVHFADGSPMVESQPSAFGDIKTDDCTAPGSKIRLTPFESIPFEQDGLELTGRLSVTNISENIITYKMKTTSADKFRVKPCVSLLRPGQSEVITLILLPGYSGASILREKFLIMYFTLPHADFSIGDLNDAWKNSDPKILEHHKLKCCVPGLQQTISLNGAPGHSLSSGSLNLSSASDFEQKVSQLLMTADHLNESNSKIHSDIKFLQKLGWLILLVGICLGVGLFYMFQKSENMLQQQQHCYRPASPIPDVTID